MFPGIGLETLLGKRTPKLAPLRACGRRSYGTVLLGYSNGSCGSVCRRAVIRTDGRQQHVGWEDWPFDRALATHPLGSTTGTIIRAASRIGNRSTDLATNRKYRPCSCERDCVLSEHLMTGEWSSAWMMSSIGYDDREHERQRRPGWVSTCCGTIREGGFGQ